jgi:hypothetical protein
MIYLAAPYTADPVGNFARLIVVAADLHRKGYRVISPVLHWHKVAEYEALNPSAEYWWDYNKHLLDLCQKLMVVQLPGWDDSPGVKMEIDHAKAKLYPVQYHPVEFK